MRHTVGGRAARARRSGVALPVATIRIGTSGWHYRHWVGPVYPDGTPSPDFFALYARRFDTVELNATFYRLPNPETVDEWRAAAPAGFAFACKASRYITHMKKLKDPEQSISRFFAAVDRLADRLGPILFQLPPRWSVDVDRLDTFLRALPDGHRYAFELRDPSWFAPAVYDVLARHDAAFCLYDLAGRAVPEEITTNFVYVRLHGPGEAYAGRYDDAALTDWADRMIAWTAGGTSVWCYFDNDEKGYAVENALALKALIEGRREPGPKAA